MKHSLWIMLIVAIVGAWGNRGQAADAAVDPVRERQMRERYETVLLRNPFQERAFDQLQQHQQGVDDRQQEHRGG